MTSKALPWPLASVDWSASPLGPSSQWPLELLTAVRALMPSRLPIMICWGEDLVQIYNDAFAPLLAQKHPAAMGQRAPDCWAEEWQRIGPLVEDFMAGGRTLFNEELPLFLNRHGYLEETYWSFSVNVIPGADSERQGLMLLAIDDTARVVSNRRLSTIHELSVMSTAGMMSLGEVCQAALKVMSRNRQALPFAAIYLREGSELRLVASYGESQGRPVFPGTIAEDAENTVARVARTGLREVLDHLEKVADVGNIDASPLGKAVPTSAMLIPLLLSGEAEALGVLVLGVNPYRAIDAEYHNFFELASRQLGTLLTDARAYQDQRGRAEMLAALQESRTRFFQNVSHEFRTPLTLVLCGLESVSVGGSGQDAEQLDAARHAALRLERLVDALLTFAQAESGALVAQREATDLVQLTGEAATMFRSAIEQSDIQYVVELPDKPMFVDIDREMWSRIVVNLLSNAYKFTAHGRIRVRLGTSKDWVSLTVEDTGVGIEQAALGRVFERFQQARTTQVRSGPGAGIGLALIADLVRAHQGKVDVSSEPGVGSTFSVSLPLMSSATGAPTAASVDERIQDQTISEIDGKPDAPQGRTYVGATASAVQDGAVFNPTGRRLLLVEDNGDLRRSKGWAVTAVPDAESALRHTEVPDIILTDVMLPGRDGLSLVRMIRANPDLATVPVILLTARAGAESATEGLRAGADDYIVKPFNAEELLARLDVHHELTCLRNYALARAENQVSNLERALSSNRRIGAAIGVLMASRHVTSVQAFKLLRRASNESNRKLGDVADRVVLTGSLDLVV
jgi:signal transduction histidine kinase/CheY-like chemotaxis protein